MYDSLNHIKYIIDSGAHKGSTYQFHNRDTFGNPLLNETRPWPGRKQKALSSVHRHMKMVRACANFVKYARLRKDCIDTGYS